VQKYLEMFIHSAIEKGQTVIAEGMHLDPSFNSKMMEKYGDRCLSFVISIANITMHVKRMLIRCKRMKINLEKEEMTTQFTNVIEI